MGVAHRKRWDDRRVDNELCEVATIHEHPVLEGRQKKRMTHQVVCVEHFDVLVDDAAGRARADAVGRYPMIGVHSSLKQGRTSKAHAVSISVLGPTASVADGR